MAKFRKKPVVIEAVQLTLEAPWEEIRAFCPSCIAQSDHRLLIPTLEGQMIANVGDWIIRGVNGEFYPCKPDIFEKTYDALTTGWKEEE